jgi:uncharacterized protein YigE (DUF2233 family)
LAQRGGKLLFAMNAGMFRTDYSAVGLLVIGGKQLHRLNLASGYGNFYLKPNGVFVLSASGAQLLESSEYRSLQEPAMDATQSGPLLVRDGRINSAFNESGTSRLIRNGVGVISPHQVVFAISDDPVNFYEFALLFRDRLKCPTALYFDGNVSSLYFPGSGRNDHSVPLGPIVAVSAGPQESAVPTQMSKHLTRHIPTTAEVESHHTALRGARTIADGRASLCTSAGPTTCSSHLQQATS